MDKDVDAILNYYFNDNKDKINDKEKVFEFIDNSLKELKEEQDFFYYEFVNDYSFSQKQKIIYSFVNNKYYEEGLLGADPPRVAGDLNIIKNLYDQVPFYGSKEQRDIYNSINRFKENIIEKDYSNCLKKCGVDQIQRPKEFKQIEKFIAMNQSNPGDHRLQKTVYNKVECLINCHFDYLTTLFAELSLSYKTCLTKSGITEIPKETGLDGIMSNIPPSADCRPFYEQLLELQKTFTEGLDLIYPLDNREYVKQRDEWINILNQKVIEANKGNHLRQNIPLVQKTLKQKFINI